MHISLSIIFVLIGSTWTQKKGDFGILTACISKNCLRLECYYAQCPGSPLYSCEFSSCDGFKPANECKPCLQGHPELYGNKTTTYKCKLTRKDRTEEKQITIDYSIKKGKGHIKPCKDTTGLLLHRDQTFLWPVVILSLWTTQNVFINM